VVWQGSRQVWFFVFSVKEQGKIYRFDLHRLRDYLSAQGSMVATDKKSRRGGMLMIA
jgi:hypothetical protein